MNRIMTRKEVAMYTESHTKQGQIDVLDRHGIHYIIARTGWPVVLWSSVERLTESRPSKTSGHNFEALTRGAA